MEEKIKEIGNLFISCLSTINLLDPTMEQDLYFKLPEEDRKLLKCMYKTYNMKRIFKRYYIFKAYIFKKSLEKLEHPISIGIDICEKLNKQ